MAAARPTTRSMDENLANRQGKAAQAQGSKRRALGDIGNVKAPHAGAKQQQDKQEKPPRRSSTGLHDPGTQGPTLKQVVDAPVRLTRSQTRALAQGVSLSALLQARGAAATASSSRRTSQAQQHYQQQQQQEEGHQRQQQPRQQQQQRQQQQRQQQAAPLRAPRSPLPDIDAPDRHNHLAECSYVNDIYAYFRRVEPRFRAPANYMEQQPDINEKMRAILIDWLVEVHLKFKLMPESLFLTTNLIDRYLAVRKVTRKNLQLVGVTAMLVAAKYEEIWAPEVRDFVYISDKAYSRKQILDTEKDMLQALGYNLSLPTSYQFLARLLKAANVHYDKSLALFVAYCAELCLVDHGMLRHSYSELAAGIMYVAMRAFNKPDPYPRSLMRHAHATRESVLHIAKDVVRLVQAAPGGSLQAVVKKYSTAKFCEASGVKPPLEILDE